MKKLTQKMQVLCALQLIFLIFNCQTPVYPPWTQVVLIFINKCPPEI